MSIFGRYSQRIMRIVLESSTTRARMLSLFCAKCIVRRAISLGNEEVPLDAAPATRSAIRRLPELSECAHQSRIVFASFLTGRRDFRQEGSKDYTALMSTLTQLRKPSY